MMPAPAKFTIRNLPDFDNNSADLAEKIRTEYTLFSIEKTISKSTSRYKKLFNKIPVPCALLNTEGVFLEINREWTKVLGYDRKKIEGLNILNFTQKKENVKNILTSSVKKSRNISAESIFIKENGELLPVIMSCSVLYDGSDRTERILCTIADITLQSASIKSLSYKSRLFDAVGSSVSFLLKSGSVSGDISDILHILGVAVEASRVSIFFNETRVPEEDSYTKRFHWISPDIKYCPDNCDILTIFNHIKNDPEKKISGKVTNPVVIINKHTNSTIDQILEKSKTLSVLCIPISFEDKKAIITVEDCTTGREWSQDEIDALVIAAKILGMILKLKHTELKNISILENSPDLIGTLTKSGYLLHANPASEKIFGLKKRGSHVYHIKDLFKNENVEKLKSHIDSVIQKNCPVTENYSLLLKNGEKQINLMIFPLKSESENKDVIFFGRDITDIKKYEDRLLLTQFAVESSPESIYYLNKKGNIIYANRSACNLTKYSKNEFLKKTVYDINPDLDPEKWEKHWAELKSKGNLKYEITLRKADGSTIPVEVEKNYLNISGEELSCSYARGIRERKETEKAL